MASKALFLLSVVSSNIALAANPSFAQPVEMRQNAADTRIGVFVGQLQDKDPAKRIEALRGIAGEEQLQMSRPSVQAESEVVSRLVGFIKDEQFADVKLAAVLALFLYDHDERVGHTEILRLYLSCLDGSVLSAAPGHDLPRSEAYGMLSNIFNLDSPGAAISSDLKSRAASIYDLLLSDIKNASSAARQRAVADLVVYSFDYRISLYRPADTFKVLMAVLKDRDERRSVLRAISRHKMTDGADLVMDALNSSRPQDINDVLFAVTALDIKEALPLIIKKVGGLTHSYDSTTVRNIAMAIDVLDRDKGLAMLELMKDGPNAYVRKNVNEIIKLLKDSGFLEKIKRAIFHQ